MGWFDTTNESWIEQNENGWESLADNTPAGVVGPVYWLSIDNFTFALLTESQWEGQQEFQYADPPYIDSGYVNGVCNHTVFVIPN